MKQKMRTAEVGSRTTEARESVQISNNRSMQPNSQAVTRAAISLEQAYVFRDKPRVSEFLSKEPELNTILFKAAPIIAKYLPVRQLCLDVYRDREQPDYSLLALRIETTLQYPDVRSALRRFIQEWWIPNTSEYLTKDVAIDTETVLC